MVQEASSANPGRLSPASRLWLSLATLGLVLMVWMNQSIPFHEWEVLKERVFETHTASTFETVRYPVMFMYRRASDEDLYFHLTGAMLGKPVDRELVGKAREGSGEAFDKPTPPADGQWHPPYTEVPVEYPPLVLPFILVPRMLTDAPRYFCWMFGALMGACLAGSVAVLARALLRAGKSARELSLRVFLISLVFLAHGGIAIQRLDAVTALLIALATAAWIDRAYDRLAFWLGLAAASKFLPILLLLPIAAADETFLRSALRAATPEARRQGRAATVRLFAIAGMTFALGLGPFFAFSPTALGDVLRYHGARGLHGESVLGSLWALVASSGPAVHAYGSYNLPGTVADVLARVAMPLSLAAIVAFAWFVYHRGSGAVVRAGLVVLGALTILWSTGKVFSPQYLTWGIPFLLFLPAPALRRGALLYAALVGISQLYFRGYFDAIYNLEPLGLWTLFARNLILGALVVFVVRLCREDEASPASP